jgi:hypothetical protein
MSKPPIEVLNGSVTLTSEDNQKIIKWYLENIHGKQVTVVYMSNNGGATVYTKDPAPKIEINTNKKPEAERVINLDVDNPAIDII